MKPTLHVLKTECPDIDEQVLQQHLDRLDVHYFKRFDLAAVCQHLKGLVKLSPQNPVELYWEFPTPDTIACTILAYNYAGEFALITGLMAGMGLNIHSGGIHTYTPVVSNTTLRSQRKSPYAYRKLTQDPLTRRKIVDHFVGHLETDMAVDAWTNEFQERLKKIIAFVETGTPESIAEAKHLVNEKVARRLEKLHLSAHPVLYPVEIQIDNQEESFTRLKVVSQDTPGFLYAMSNALSVKGISIEHVRIHTARHRIEDLIDFVDQKGNKITDPALLDQIKLSVLITKQFTYFLGNAPDPYSALRRFETLVEDVLRLPEHGKWLDLLGDPKILQELARLLGTSDFLWEDMIRLQYETLLPMLAPEVENRRFADAMETLPERLEQALRSAEDLPTQCQRLNEFKDREIFLIDLDHILTPGSDLRQLAEYLTYLAMVVVRKTVRLNYESLVGRYGRPRTVGGLEVRLAILGLGKFGGAALGYASDIELLFVYSDHGQTDGSHSITNSEFFENLVQDSVRFIHAKREGIFNTDLRLRPYGEDGPLACSLESFCNYYGPGGQAHSLERLALVRLRAIGGDTELGAQVERLRDEFIYTGSAIQLEDLQELRSKQFEEKTRGGKLNAKFSPGALVDLEYDVQILQVMYGKEHAKLRTPRIHQALAALQEAGVLKNEEANQLVQAYTFLRHLINGLRMLRGSAEDLFLPSPETDEYQHLARRLGYTLEPGLDPGQKLYMEFETRTAAVRVFAERYFGRESLPGEDSGNIADIILSEKLTPHLREKILVRSGFANPQRADLNLSRLSAAAAAHESFARLAVLAVDILRRKPDPDMALNNWERFVQSLSEPHKHFENMLSQPMRLEILLSIFASSQFLADILIRNPEFLDWATDSKNLHSVFERDTYLHLILQSTREMKTEEAWLNALRLFRRREFLRIGTKDICLHASLPEITLELSNLADALVQVALDQVWDQLRQAGKLPPAGWDHPEKHFCVLALGKLGGRELNYSSDIDLLGVCSDEADELLKQAGTENNANPFVLALESMRAILSQYTDQGYIYRVDFRLRPYGIEGQLVSTLKSLGDYYQQHAALSEIQALLKLRPIAGSLALGQRLLEKTQNLILKGYQPTEVAQTIEHTRNLAVRQTTVRSAHTTDVKSGVGGIRDIEFLIQGLQMIHAQTNPQILEGNTLFAMKQLSQAGLLAALQVDQLSEDYVYLRRLEHYLQIMEDRQIHTLPEDQQELAALAKRMHGPETDTAQFLDNLTQRLTRIRKIYQTLLLDKK